MKVPPGLTVTAHRARPRLLRRLPNLVIPAANPVRFRVHVFKGEGVVADERCLLQVSQIVRGGGLALKIISRFL